MEQNKGTKFAILPVYLVLNTSASMSDNGAIEAAINLVPQMIDTLERQPSVADKIRVEIIRFDKNAEFMFSLGGKSALDEWWEQNRTSAFHADGETACYGAAFRLLRSRIEIGTKQIKAEDAPEPGQKFLVYRPVVFLITDGKPLDKPADRERACSELTHFGFSERPNSVCIGVGDAKAEALKPYGAGKSNTSDNKYAVGNISHVFVAKDGVAPADALQKIIPKIIDSIVHSVGNQNNPEKKNPSDERDAFDLEDIFKPDADDPYDPFQSI